MNVGATALTVTPWRPHSMARHLVRCVIAALAWLDQFVPGERPRHLGLFLSTLRDLSDC